MFITRINEDYMVVEHCDDASLFFKDGEIAYEDGNGENTTIDEKWEQHKTQITDFISFVESEEELRKAISDGYIEIW